MENRPKVINLVLVFFFVFSALGVIPKPVKAAASDLFFSEYVEGSSLNKALEIYNGTGGSIDLAAGAYQIKFYFNGNTSASLTINLTGTVADGDVYVVADDGADAAILAETDQQSTASLFNGDDAIELVKGSTTLDVIGQIGFDPGSQWGSGLVSTADNTIRRKVDVCQGDPDGSNTFDPSVEWDGYDNNTFAGLGSHTANCDFSVSEPKINEFSASTTSTDVEFVEIYGDALTDYSAYSILEIEGDSTSAVGAIDEVITMGTTDGSGFYLQSLPANALENGTISLLLVKDFTGAADEDIDEDNDGIMDYTPWSAIVDSVAVNDGGTGDITYGAPVLYAYYDGMNYGPGGASRLPDGYDTNSQSDWVRNEFDLDNNPAAGEAYNTPGTTNLANGTAPEMPPEVTKTLPLNGAASVALEANIEIVFSEVVNLAADWFEISCTSSGVHTATVDDTANPVITLNPITDFAEVETCTVTVFAEKVNDSDTNDSTHDYMESNYVFSFNTMQFCGAPFTPIYDIQGNGATTPLYGTALATEGVVVGDFQVGGKNGFFIQDPTGDSDLTTSDGIFIYAPSSMDVNVGDLVRVEGTAGEYNNLTQVSASQVWQCDTGMTLPEPAELSLPVTSLDDFEAFEGMYVTFPQDLVISEYFNYDRYGEIVLTSQRHLTPTAFVEPGAPAIAEAQAFLLDRITLDDGRTNQNPDPAIHPNGLEFTTFNRFRGGDLVTNLTGVLDYSFNLYRVQPTQGADYTAANLRTAEPAIINGDIKIASFNVLNYFTSLDDGPDNCGPSEDMECRGADTSEEFERQRIKIIEGISIIDADIVGLMEIENDRLSLTADYAVADLVAGLNEKMGADTYAYIATGAIGTDAIKVALIYKPGKVTPLGDFAILDSTVDPRFLDDYNRPVLAQTFVDNQVGEAITVAVNHLKSKGSECDAVDDPDLGDGQGNCNLTRLKAAQAEVDWLASDPTGTGVDRYLIIGDLNSYDKEDPIDAIKLGADDTADTDDDFVDMVHEINGDAAYGYVFDGQVGYLDYALVSKNLVEFVADANIWHVNADEPDIIDYDMSFKAPAQDALWEPNAYRASDHDPTIITLTFNQGPVANDDYYEIDHDVTLTVPAPGVLVNDYDLNEYDQITLDLQNGPEHGTLTFNPDGSFEYIPDPGFFGVDVFSYFLTAFPPGSRGEYTDVGYVFITVYPEFQYFMPFFVNE